MPDTGFSGGGGTDDSDNPVPHSGPQPGEETTQTGGKSRRQRTSGTGTHDQNDPGVNEPGAMPNVDEGGVGDSAGGDEQPERPGRAPGRR